MDDTNEIIDRLRALGAEPVDTALQSAHLTAMAEVRTSARASHWPKLRVAAALLAGFLLGSTGLATANALPDPAQNIAHSVLGQVGINVPKPDRYHDDQECGTAVKRNHGAYVRDDKSLAQTDCGKPVKGANAIGGTADPKESTGPCGKPPWATDKSMTAEERAAAQDERTDLCGPDLDADELETEAPADSLESEEKSAPSDLETTTTTAAPETTTTTLAPEATTTTTTTATTTTTV